MENNRIWNVVINSNVLLGDVEETNQILQSTVYTDFETAKNEALRAIDAFVHSSNGLFDGNGGIVGFNDYFERMGIDKDDETFNFEGQATTAEVIDFRESLRESLESGLKSIPDPIYWTDYLLEVSSEDGCVDLRGIDDGPCNGIDPIVRINMFDMNDPTQNYVFYVRGPFGEPSYVLNDYEPVKYFSLNCFSMFTNDKIDLSIYE
ncbi:MAG: hypothetical protein IJT91_01060 [Clostridia bacterium]|nr:hypothetical protein [Clostridia bacterium]